MEQKPEFSWKQFALSCVIVLAAGVAASAILARLVGRTFADALFLVSLLVLAAGCLFVVFSGPKSHTGPAFRKVFARDHESYRARKAAAESEVLGSAGNPLFRLRAVVCFVCAAAGIVCSVLLNPPV